MVRSDTTPPPPVTGLGTPKITQNYPGLAGLDQNGLRPLGHA